MHVHMWRGVAWHSLRASFSVNLEITLPSATESLPASLRSLASLAPSLASLVWSRLVSAGLGSAWVYE